MQHEAKRSDALQTRDRCTLNPPISEFVTPRSAVHHSVLHRIRERNVQAARRS
jgi:hypothetical protein